jgi:hypothetical protein
MGGVGDRGEEVGFDVSKKRWRRSGQHGPLAGFHPCSSPVRLRRLIALSTTPLAQFARIAFYIQPELHLVSFSRLHLPSLHVSPLPRGIRPPACLRPVPNLLQILLIIHHHQHSHPIFCPPTTPQPPTPSRLEQTSISAGFR